MGGVPMLRFDGPLDFSRLRFGNDSFKPHLAAARAIGKPVVVLPLSGIALDIDTATDLRRLAESPGRSTRNAWFDEFDLTDLPRAANE